MSLVDRLRAALDSPDADDTHWQVFADALCEMGHPDASAVGLVRDLFDAERPGRAIEAAARLSGPRWLVDVVVRCWLDDDPSAVEAGAARLGLALPSAVQRYVSQLIDGVNSRHRGRRVTIAQWIGTAAAALRSPAGFAISAEPPYGTARVASRAVVLAWVDVERDVVVVGGAHHRTGDAVPRRWSPDLTGAPRVWQPAMAREVAQLRAWGRREAGDRVAIGRLPFEIGDVDAGSLEAWIELRRRLGTLSEAGRSAIPDAMMSLAVDGTPDRWIQGRVAAQPEPEVVHLEVTLHDSNDVDRLAGAFAAGWWPDLATLGLGIAAHLEDVPQRLLAGGVPASVQSLGIHVREFDHRAAEPWGDVRPLVEAFVGIRELVLLASACSTGPGRPEPPDLRQHRDLRRLRLLGDWSVAAVRRVVADTHLEALEVRAAHPPVLEAVLGSSRLAQLHLNAMRLRDDDLADVVEVLPELRVLELVNNRLGPHGAEAIAMAPLARPLRALSLSGNAIGDEGLEALGFGEGPWALETLRLRACGIGDVGMRDLAHSALLDGLRRLDLAHNRIGPRGISALTRGGRPTRVVELDLSGNPLGNAGGQALAEWPGLASVAWIDLTGCRIGPAGRAALARSPWFRARERHGLPADFRSRNDLGATST